MSESVPFDDKLLGMIAGKRQGVLATIAADGRPQLTNVLYVWDAEERVARIGAMDPVKATPGTIRGDYALDTTTADRVKARNLLRDPRAALHVSGRHFWQYAVADGVVTLSQVAYEPGDEATRELLDVHAVHYGEQDEDEFYRKMIAARRLVVRLRVRRIYGVALDEPPGT